MEAWYWTIFAFLFGACTGSFVNVIIYRWPRGISLLSPSRSFCPTCEHPIAWYDNIPVVSYLRLGGLCRHCGRPISMQYPLVELATMLVFVITFDAFFVGHQRLGIGDMADDWPILVAHWLLWAGMIALTVMDLEVYLVEINVTWAILMVGLLGHTLWTPARSAEWVRPGPGQALFAVAVVVGLGIAAVLFLRRTQGPEEESIEQGEEPSPAEPEQTQPGKRRIGFGLILALLMVIGYAAAVGLMGEQHSLPHPQQLEDRRLSMQAATELDGGAIRLAAGLFLVFIGLVIAGSRPSPEADEAIVAAIHEEAPLARRNALRELTLLLPAIVLGVACLFLLGSTSGSKIESGVDRLLHWAPLGRWQPLWGLSTALVGWVIGGTIAWLTRILGTLMFGKEALGMGDVHILAAAGAVAGWPVALLGFFLAALLALLGLLIIHFRRQSRMLPYVPWLALGCLVASVYQDRILIFLQVRWLFDG